MSNYSTGEPLTTTVDPLTITCYDYRVETASFVNWYTLASAIYLFALSFRIKRTALWLKCCDSRPGLTFPIDFLTDPSRRIDFSAVMIIFAGRIAQIYNGQRFWMPSVYTTNPSFATSYPFVSSLLTYVFIVQLSLCFYALTLCIQFRRYHAANVMGILFLIPWIASSSLYYINFQACLPIRTVNSVIDDVTTDIPIWIAYILLLIGFIRSLVKNTRRCLNKVDPSPYDKSPNVTYVRLLLKDAHTETKGGEGRLRKNRYNVIEGFRYPLRISVTMVVALFVLFRIYMLAGLIVKGMYDQYELGFYDQYIYMGLQMQNATGRINTVRTAITVFYYGFWACSTISALISVFSVAHTLRRYRKHVRRLLIGNTAWFNPMMKKLTNPDVMALNMRYTGFQVAFTSYGYCVLLLAILFVYALIAFGLILPLTDKFTSLVLDRVYGIWPTLVLTMVLAYVQKFTAKYLFLQDKGETGLALDNKKAYHIFEYFVFFFNAVYGFYVANRRLLYSMFAGAFRIGRLDYCYMLRGFDNLDEGHKTYLSVLIMELHHNHPVLRCFSEILPYEAMKTRDNTEMEISKTRRRARLRWFKYYTLIKNQSLIEDYRKSKMPKKLKDDDFTVVEVSVVENAKGDIMCTSPEYGTVAVSTYM